MTDDFLLNTPLARRLYHECAEGLPIIDYHNHLNVQELADNKNYKNLARLWLVSDPYKHRAMRICGTAERYITGDASDYEKFEAWMKTLPKLLGNPLYDWSVLEMKRIFGIDLVPGITDTKWLWETANEMLAQPSFTPLALLERFRVEYAAPCAALGDDVSAFAQMRSLAPSLRADALAALDMAELRKLGRVTSLEELTQAIGKRLEEFHRCGCRFADHALDNGFRYYEEDGQNEARFARLLRGDLEAEEGKKLTCCILRLLAAGYARRGWTMQLHIGAQRYTSSRLRKTAGPAGGFAGIGSGCDVISLTKMLDDFEQQGMPNILLFTLNPADNAVMSVLSGSYTQEGIPGKVQQGPAWWWCDHLQGMREVFDHISSFSVLSVFIGMTTDSRSILSFVRHEYFRRALCGWLGDKVQQGAFPDSFELLKPLVENICYYNAKQVTTQ